MRWNNKEVIDEKKIKFRTMFPSLGPKIEKLIGKEQELLDAARTGNVEAIEKLCANSNKTRKSTVGAKLHSFFKSVNINCRDKNGYTPLHHAVLNEYQEVVTLLLHYEAQPNIVDNQGCNPVHLAAWKGNQEILRLLLSAGTMPDDTGIEPVHVNQQNGSGDTALHCAAQYGHVEVVDVLLQRQANPSIRNLTEASPLDLAAQYGHLDVVNLLLMSHPELVQRPSCTQSPLHLAAGNGHLEIVALLLDNQFDIQTMTEAGTCLHQAALHGKLNVVKLLLERGINVHSQDKNGNTALMLVEVHQTKQKSYSDITKVIKVHIARTEGKSLPSEEPEDLGAYDTLASCSSGHNNSIHGDNSQGISPTTTNGMQPDRMEASIKQSPVPSPRSGSLSEARTPDRSILKKRPSVKTPPDTAERAASPPYAVVNKGKSGALESEGTTSPPPALSPLPPLPPRFSYMPREESSSAPDLTEAGLDSIPDKLKPIPKARSMLTPVKPPRTKKSPAMKRRSPPTVCDQIPDSPLSSPISTGSFDNLHSTCDIPDNKNTSKDTDIPDTTNISKETDQIKPDDSKQPLLNSNLDFDLIVTDASECIVDQSNVTKTDNSTCSPMPELPPKTRLSAAAILDGQKVDNSVDPVTEVQGRESYPTVNSNVEELSALESDASPGVTNDVIAEEKGETEGTSECCEAANSVKPKYLDFLKRSSGDPLTPTGYPQPPTPDFPPPSPATALMGIELKIQEMDSKRKSRDMTTLTDEILDSLESHTQPTRVEEPIPQFTAGSKLVHTITEVNEDETKNHIYELTQSGSEISDSVLTKGDFEEKKPKPSEMFKDNTKKPLAASKVGGERSNEKPVIKPKSFRSNSENKGVPKSSTIPSSSVIKNQSGSIQEETTAEKMTRSAGNQSKAGSGSCRSPEGADSPVMLRKKSSPDPDMDMFKGLMRGSVIGGPREVLSQFYDDPVRKKPAVPPRFESTSVAALRKNLMERGDDIDVDQFMQTLDAEVARRSTITDPSQFDDSEEWDKIADIVSSFGGNLTPTYVPAEEVFDFNTELEAYMDKILSGATTDEGSNHVISVGEWLQSLGLGLYENAFIGHGFDNIDFLDSKILEEQDLEQIGVLSHDHRQKILQAAKSLPQLKPIDPKCPPKSVQEWLTSLYLQDYLETFRSHGYDTMEKVESILWELQLRTVLDISVLGHRKRILASLGERQMPERHHAHKKSIGSLSPDEGRSRFHDLEFLRDYNNIKPTSSSEEDIKGSTQMQVDSSEDEDVFLKKKGGQQISNSNIHVRPPHMANTNSPAKMWRHKPEMLIKGCCNYTAQYLGSTIVPELTGGTQSTRAGITKLKLRFLRQLQVSRQSIMKSTDVLSKIPIIMLSISYKGVKFIDAKTKKVICDHEIGNIFCACQDTENLNFFAYITRDIESGQHYCHVFSVKSASLAHDIILTLGESFEVAYQMALKEKANKEAMELDRKMSQSDVEDSCSVTSKMSTNTV